MKISCFILLLIGLTFSSFTFDEPQKISWEILKDVTFKKKWDAKESIFMLYPTFGPNVKKVENKTVLIKGYMVPIDPESNQYVLSAFPYSMCFFCGGAGPESVMGLKLKKNQRFKTDDIHTFKGKLLLNANDIYELNYILSEAEVVD
jgi:hypothetical protein